jgi:pimeloyl-ACP methyl ester carboxylesterase
MVTVQEAQVMRQIAPSVHLKTATLPSGLRLPYVEQGDSSGLPVVLLHGFSDSWWSWAPVLPHLPASIYAYALSQRGHGDADRPATGYRFEDLAADLAAFMDTLGIERAVIGGHSMGSYVAQRFAMDHPDRVLGLVLVGSVTTWRGNPAIAEIWESGIATLTDPIDPRFVGEFQISPRLPQAFIDIAIRESLKVPARVWRDAWQAIMTTDFSADLDKIAAPTLIIWGDQDPLCPRAEQETLTAAIASSYLIIYPGGGHNLHWEEPERFADDLLSFVNQLDFRIPTMPSQQG